MTRSYSDERIAIEAAAVSYLTAFARADAEDVLATYADDGVLMAPGMPAAVGKDALASVYPEVFNAVEFAMAYAIKEVEQISADWGFVRSTTDGTETDKATGASVTSAYQELFLLRKADSGAWQIARYCTSKVSPA